MRVRQRPTRAEETGISIVELVVAMTLFMVVLLGVTSTLYGSLAVAANNRSRTIAANLATQEADTVRSLDYETAATPVPDRTQTVNGKDYTVEREIETVPLDARGDSCQVAHGGAPQVLRVTSRVTWENMGATKPVVAHTLVSPPAGNTKPNTGHVAVKVVDRDGKPLKDATANVSGGSVNKNLFTTVDGCAFFAQLDPRTYTVTVSKPGYVDRALQPAPQASATVTKGQVTVTPTFVIDNAATLRLTLVGAFGGTLPEDDIPLGLGNTALQPTGWMQVTGEGSTRELDDLFPFNDGYRVWAGTCEDADPGAEYSPALPARPGETVVGQVTLATVAITTTGGGQVRAAHSADSRCTSGMDMRLGNSHGPGTMTLALPYGTWTLRRGSTSVVVTLSGSATGPVPVVL